MFVFVYCITGYNVYRLFLNYIANRDISVPTSHRGVGAVNNKSCALQAVIRLIILIYRYIFILYFCNLIL